MDVWTPIFPFFKFLFHEEEVGGALAVEPIRNVSFPSKYLNKEKLLIIELFLFLSPVIQQLTLFT